MQVNQPEVEEQRETSGGSKGPKLCQCTYITTAREGEREGQVTWAVVRAIGKKVATSDVAAAAAIVGTNLPLKWICLLHFFQAATKLFFLTAVAIATRTARTARPAALAPAHAPSTACNTLN